MGIDDQVIVVDEHDLCNACVACLHRKMNMLSEEIIKATQTIEKVSIEVMPTINGLMENPMLKMLLNKGKK